MPSTTRPRPSNAGVDATPALLLALAVLELGAIVPVTAGPAAVVTSPVTLRVAPPLPVLVLPPGLPGKIAVGLAVTSTLLASPLTFGIPVSLALNSTTLLLVLLKFVCAMAMMLLCKS
jgi:hypothetical protein